MTPKLCSQVSLEKIVHVDEKQKEKKFRPAWSVWRNVCVIGLAHLGALYGAYLVFVSAKWQTTLFAIIVDQLSLLGITAGTHRLWCHQSYKAKLPLRIFLAFLSTIALQGPIYEWNRDHRLHHKYCETNADPYNVARGFFFSHIGWLFQRKHPEVIEKGKTINMDDISKDPVVRFQRRYYNRLVVLCSVILPTIIPMYFWDESFLNAFMISVALRYALSLNQTGLVNSAAHMWGSRPYDANMYGHENYLISLYTNGESFHNYHHTFPYDYATSEYGLTFNLTTMFIDAMAFIGQAYDRKSVPPHVIEARKKRTGEKKEPSATTE